MFNLKYGRRAARDVLRQLADEVLPRVHEATCAARVESE
jgi:hypothetical protein